MEVIGILSLIFGIIGLLSSVQYIGILPCVVGIVLGIVGLTDFLSDKKFATAGLLISIFGAVVSVYIYVSDIDSGRLVVIHNNGKSQSVDVESKTKKDSGQVSSVWNSNLNTENNSTEIYQTSTEKETKEIPVENESLTEQNEAVSEPKIKNEQKNESVRDGELAIGDTWTVDGQWKLTINSVQETFDRNPYSDKKPEAVYLVTYTYENLGYEDSFLDGLFISIDDSIVDNAGKMGYSYPGDQQKYAQETPIGATCEAQACIGVDNAGSFKIYVDKYDGNGNKHKAIFNLVF